MTLSEAQAAEIAKYERAHQHPGYRMARFRRAHYETLIVATPHRGSALDIGCGRGEAMEMAIRAGFNPVIGTDVVPHHCGLRCKYAVAWDQPFEDDSQDLVLLLDVIEHLLPGDDEKACREIERVCRKSALIAPNNDSSPSKATGEELHVNRRAYDEWDALFREWFAGDVTRIDPLAEEPRLTPVWRVTF